MNHQILKLAYQIYFPTSLSKGNAMKKIEEGDDKMKYAAVERQILLFFSAMCTKHLYFNPIHPLCIRYVCTMHVLLSFRCHIFQMFLFLMLLFLVFCHWHKLFIIYSFSCEKVFSFFSARKRVNRVRT